MRSGNAMAIVAGFVLLVLLGLALLGVGPPGVPVLMMGLGLSIPFWVLVVWPVYFLSGHGKRWSLGLTVVFCFLVLATLFLLSQWTPDVHGLELGNKVLVADGIATEAYYRDLLESMVVAAFLVTLGAPIFAWLVRRHLPEQ